MTGTLDLTRPDLFEDGRAHERVSTLLKQALARRMAVVLTSRADGATLTLEGGPSVSGILLEGAWRAPGIEPAAITDPGARLFLPLLFDPAVIRLCPADLVTLGQPYRPVADLFARCLFFAGLRGAPIAWQTGPIGAPDITRDLLRRYYFVFKAYLPDPTLGTRPAAEALDLLLANLYFETLSFENPLLRTGARALREGKAAAGLRLDLERARAAMLALVAS